MTEIEALRKFAADVCELESRGDMVIIPKLGVFFRACMIAIANGRLAPELFIAAKDNTALIKRGGGLKIPDQLSLAKNDPVEVVVLKEGGKGTYVRKIPAHDLTPKQLRQVIEQKKQWWNELVRIVERKKKSR